MRGVHCLAPAKVNLALHVTGQREDGYHTLDTLAAFCELGDVVTVTAGEARSDKLQLSGPFSAGISCSADNLALRATAGLRRTLSGRSLPPVSIHVEKNIPAGAGLGGGSADAAATLLALKAFWNIAEKTDLAAIAATLGADVPMCLSSRPLRAQGTGERISPIKMVEDWAALLVFPGKGLSTASVFAALENRANPPIELDCKAAFQPDVLRSLRNDLQAPAATLCPAITDVIAALENMEKSLLVRMSGSGSACYALFEDMLAAEAAAEAIGRERPDWWCEPTRIMAAARPDRLTSTGD